MALGYSAGPGRACPGSPVLDYIGQNLAQFRVVIVVEIVSGPVQLGRGLPKDVGLTRGEVVDAQ
jgi:hypothetical protein